MQDSLKRIEQIKKRLAKANSKVGEEALEFVAFAEADVCWLLELVEQQQARIQELESEKESTE